jgi:ribonuclease HII
VRFLEREAFSEQLPDNQLVVLDKGFPSSVSPLPFSEQEHSFVEQVVSLPEKEISRLLAMQIFEKKARRFGFSKVAGADEAGRGPLAGPVVACICLLPENYLLKGLNDSKKLTPSQRESLFKALTQDESVFFGIGIVDSIVIDKINILQATYEAVRLAYQNIKVVPDYLICDGMSVPGLPIPCEKVIQGDQRSLSCAAASVIAKVTRDEIMKEANEKWPQYGFLSHKGYGTALHIKAIEEFGPTPIHRMSFAPLKKRD